MFVHGWGKSIEWLLVLNCSVTVLVGGSRASELSSQTHTKSVLSPVPAFRIGLEVFWEGWQKAAPYVFARHRSQSVGNYRTQGIILQRITHFPQTN